MSVSKFKDGGAHHRHAVLKGLNLLAAFFRGNNINSLYIVYIRVETSLYVVYIRVETSLYVVYIRVETR